MAKTKAAKQPPFRSRGTIETWAPRSRPRVLAKVAPGASSVGVPRVTKPCATRSKPGTSELVFLPAAEAGAAGATPGATVRLCTGKKKPGYLVSVRSAEEATRVARDWKVCMTGAGAEGAEGAARAKACAEKVAPQARFGQGPAAPGGRSVLERPTGSTLRLGARRNQKLRHELRHARLDLETTEAAARLYPGEESERRVEAAKRQLTETEARVKARGRLGASGAPRPSDDGPADITAVKMQGMPITMFEGKRERKKR